ncbi:hypothetical protein BHE74_00055204 [Ensete ventricosum]|nr:hypothetical protein BHE74_00055204 [Ensete ventricosum]
MDCRVRFQNRYRVLLCRQQADLWHPAGNAATEVPLLVKADAAAVKHEEDYLGQGQYSVVTHCSRAASEDQCVASSSRRRLEYEEAAVGSCAKKIGSAASVSAGGSRKMARVGEAEEAGASPCRWRRRGSSWR